MGRAFVEQAGLLLSLDSSIAFILIPVTSTGDILVTLWVSVSTYLAKAGVSDHGVKIVRVDVK